MHNTLQVNDIKHFVFKQYLGNSDSVKHYITIGIPSWGFLRLFHENINGIYRKCGTSKLGSQSSKWFSFSCGPIIDVNVNYESPSGKQFLTFFAHIVK